MVYLLYAVVLKSFYSFFFFSEFLSPLLKMRTVFKTLFKDNQADLHSPKSEVNQTD